MWAIWNHLGGTSQRGTIRLKSCWSLSYLTPYFQNIIQSTCNPHRNDEGDIWHSSCHACWVLRRISDWWQRRLGPSCYQMGRENTEVKVHSLTGESSPRPDSGHACPQGGVAGPAGSAAGPPWAGGPKSLNSCLACLLSTADATLRAPCWVCPRPVLVRCWVSSFVSSTLLSMLWWSLCVASFLYFFKLKYSWLVVLC